MRLPILPLKQNTPEWHQWRAQGLGASEIAALYGKHPYLTEHQLWLQKTGQAAAFAGNVATEHGQRLESAAFLEIQYEHKGWMDELKGGVCINHATIPHLHASLDAYSDKHKIIIEIKSPYGEKNKNIRNKDDLPEYWKYQIQFQMALASSYYTKEEDKFFHGWIYICIGDGTYNDNRQFTFHEDKALQADMIQKAHEWWQHHVVMGNPVPPDTIYLSQEEVKNKLSLYEEYQHTAKQIDAKKRALKCEIEAFLDGQSNYHTETHQIIRTSPRTSYDFNAMRTDGIDLSKYRIQNGSEGSYTIKSIKSIRKKEKQ